MDQLINLIHLIHRAHYDLVGRPLGFDRHQQAEIFVEQTDGEGFGAVVFALEQASAAAIAARLRPLVVFLSRCRPTYTFRSLILGLHLDRAGRRRLARDRLATALAGIGCPTRAEGVEYEGVSRSDLACVGNNLIGVIDNRIARDTPRLVPDNPGAVLACRLRMVAVTVKPAGRGAIGHRYLLALVQRSRSASRQLSTDIV